MIGRTLSHYRVVERLGAGGMGEVYRAHDEKLQRDVALKVLPAGALSDEDARRRFRKEALTLSRLSHPHIASLFDADSAEGTDFLVMELVPGATLGEELRKGPLPEKEVVRLGTQLARGLMAAHAQGVIHRDLKPSNLALTADGLLKVLDFGVARLERWGTHVQDSGAGKQAEPTATETGPGAVVGSPPYMSPEQLLGKRVDERTDLYAAGTVLYELVTGKRPFGTKRGVELHDAVLHVAPLPPREANGGVSAGLEAVILKAMDKDPGLRYQTARELLVDLERLQAGATTSAAPRAVSVSSRPRGLVTRWVVLLSCVVVVAAWALWPPRPPRILGSRAVTRGLSTTAVPGWASDGTRAYYSERRRGVTKYYQAPLTGGGPSEIPIHFPNGNIMAYLPRQGALLVGSDTRGVPNVDDAALPLWLVTLPSGAALRLGDLRAFVAAVSPDAQRLALGYGTEREGRIGVAKADGSDLHELLKVWAGWITWAPDGERLRFGAAGPAGHENEGWIWETSTRGETPRPLWRGGPGRWTPDGRYFIFGNGTDLWAARDRSWLPGPRPSPVRLSFGPMSLFLPAFGPDARLLYAWGDVSRGELLRYDTTTQRLESYLGGVSGQFAEASPDAQWVAFITYPEQELWQCRPDGTERVQLSRPGTRAWFPRWSPDGREISFLGWEPGHDRSSLRRVSEGGGGEEILARPEAGVLYWDACWLPEGEGMVFWRHFVDQDGIFKLDLRTKKISLLPGAENLRQSTCSRQGHVLAWQDTPRRMRRVLWHGRTEWEDIDNHALAYPNWTRDGKAIIGLNMAAMRVERLDLTTRQWTTVVDLAQTPLVKTNNGIWMGLAADDSPLVVRDHSTRDLYAFDWEAP